MDSTGFLALGFTLVLLFWCMALWLLSYRNRPEKLNEILPLISRYRNKRLRPLFNDRSEVLWFALWPFLLGSLFLTLLIVNLSRR